MFGSVLASGDTVDEQERDGAGPGLAPAGQLYSAAGLMPRLWMLLANGERVVDLDGAAGWAASEKGLRREAARERGVLEVET